MTIGQLEKNNTSSEVLGQIYRPSAEEYLVIIIINIYFY